MESKTLLPERAEAYYFTVVFKGDVRDFKRNPLHIQSEFGPVVAIQRGDALANPPSPAPLSEDEAVEIMAKHMKNPIKDLTGWLIPAKEAYRALLPHLNTRHARACEVLREAIEYELDEGDATSNLAVARVRADAILKGEA